MIALPGQVVAVTRGVAEAGARIVDLPAFLDQGVEGEPQLVAVAPTAPEATAGTGNLASP